MSLENELVKLTKAVIKLTDEIVNLSAKTQHKVDLPAIKPQHVVVEDEKLNNSKVITPERAEELALKMVEIAEQLGDVDPVKQVLVEFKILSVKELPVSEEEKFVKKLDSL